MMTDSQANTAINFRWQWNAKILCFALVFLPVTVALGFWQLHRADQKSAIVAKHASLKKAVPIDFQQIIDQPDNQFRNARVTGEADNSKTLLLDNRVRRGQTGYEVLTPVRVKARNQQVWLLVNRGWVVGGMDRRRLPDIAALADGPLVGYLYRSPGKSLVLKDMQWADTAPVIQAIDFEQAANYLDGDVYSYVLRLAPDVSSALAAEWHVINVAPEKHVGYAVQWFLMALALVILTLVANSNVAAVWQQFRQRGHI